MATKRAQNKFKGYILHTAPDLIEQEGVNVNNSSAMIEKFNTLTPIKSS